MPLPTGTPKLKSQLESQADATYKDNNSTDLTKTRGVDVRQFIADLLESTYIKQEDFVETRFGTVVSLDKEAQHFKNASLQFCDTDIDVDATNARNGVVVKLYHKHSTPPNLNFTGFNAVYSATQKESYDTSKINVFVFTAIVKNTTKICEWTMYKLNI